MPAAAVIPAPLVYINNVVVKTLVVGWSSGSRCGRCRVAPFAGRGAAGGRGGCKDWNGGMAGSKPRCDALP